MEITKEKALTLLKSWGKCRIDIAMYRSDKDTAYSVYKNGVFNIVVNPTNHFREWFENLLFFFSKKEEFGFIAYSYRNAGREFYPMMKADYDGVSPIELQGASRGGAIVDDLYCRFEKDFGNENLHSTTFGQPPSGKKKAIEYFKKIGMNKTRVVNQNDCVPTKPFYGKQYEAELVELKNDNKKKYRWRIFTRCKVSHLGYGTQLQELLK